MIHHIVLCSLQDHLGTRTRYLDHPIVLPVQKHRHLVPLVVEFAACFSSARSDGSLIHAHLLHRW
jgi:hypothetical protein